MKSFGIYRIKGVVQHYEWGGFDFIPALLGQPHPSTKPCAELWLGAHGGGPSIVESRDGGLSLPDFIHSAPREVLGESVAERFDNSLPYLFKVLDARKMLSIQAHPTITQARAGFQAEEAAGVPLTATTRNYKDRNHKPEVHVALTDFWMLHGFRPLEEIAASLRDVPELRDLMPGFGERLSAADADFEARSALLRKLYERVMTMPQSEVDHFLNPLIARLEKEAPTNKNLPGFWALRAAREFPLPDGHRDRGIFSIYLLNLVRLKPGQATYQSAGTLHAYLEGVNVELMANSDNVLRGGLTPKNVDVPELMRVLCFDEGKVGIIHGRNAGNGETVFPTPAEEFELSRIQCGPGCGYQSGRRSGPDVLIVIEGEIIASSNGETLHFKAGESFFAPQAASYEIVCPTGAAVVFKASVPRLD